MPAPVKILVFAHVPPPLHGQSLMVQLILDGLRGGEFGDFEVHHVDARFSGSHEEIGTGSLLKFFRALRFCFQAVSIRIRHGVKIFFYIPAPPKASAIIRDWLVLALCRPFFPVRVFYWQAAGLGAWTLEQARGGLAMRMAAGLNRLLLGRHALSIALSEWGVNDLRPFTPSRTVVAWNGVDDPCPDFDHRLLPVRLQRQADHRRCMDRCGFPAEFHVCFLGSCTGEKGLWEALEAVALANDNLTRRGIPLAVKLRVAGEFPRPADREYFHRRVGELTSAHRLPPGWCDFAGVVQGRQKLDFLEWGDCLCFPTHYQAESFGLVAIEALAFGIPPVCTEWRMLPEIMALAGLPTTPVGRPELLAKAILDAVHRDSPVRLRQVFLDHFTARVHLQKLAGALASLP